MNNLGNTLIVIPARGGSKRLPRKNLLPLGGKPLISWTIEAALQAKLHAKILVSSDDEEILSISRDYAGRGVISHKRPANLATDTASSVDVVREAISNQKRDGFDPETVILLQPTSPLRNAEDIKNAIDLFIENPGYSVVSVCEVEHPKAWIGCLNDQGFIEGLQIDGKRSQDYKKEYRLNGAVYIADVKWIESSMTVFTEKLLASVMPRERSIDIDSRYDFDLCKYVLLNA